MNIKKTTLLTLVSLKCFLSICQGPAEKLVQWSNSHPIEKVYLHLDREEYIAGQTLWLKGYLYAEFLGISKSTTLFVELLDTSSRLIHRLSLPIANAVTQGQIELSDTLSTGLYHLRAYTATMLNQDPSFVYTRMISIQGKKPAILPQAEAPGATRMEFFPEGGNFVAGLPATIAFKATDQNGLPVPVEGVVKNNLGEILSEFKSYHDGMGMIEMDAKAEAKYYVELKGTAEKYPLPFMEEKGIVFRILNGDDGIHFEIIQKKDPIFQSAYMVGQMQHKVIFKQSLKEGLTNLTGVIKTNNLSSGILHITIFNKDGLPLAERLSFINNREYIQQARLVEDTIQFSNRARNRMTLELKDTVIGSFSVSISDPAYESQSFRQENILSRFLLSSDLKGYIHNPVYYFSSTNDSVKYALDLLMMTNGWTRFKWQQLIKEPVLPARYKDPGFINLSGRVLLEGTKKPFAGKEMLLYIIGADSSRNMQIVKTDANGYYKADSLLFFGNANIFFSDIRGKKSQFVDIKPDGDSLNKNYNLPNLSTQAWRPFVKNGLASTSNTLVKKLAEEYAEITRSKGVVLSEVVLKSKKRSPIEELDQKYTSGAFSGDTRKTFDLLHADDVVAYQNIFEYLESRVPGMITGRSETGDYFAYFRQTSTISSLGNQGMDIFLDEVLTDANTVATIHPNQIALVKVYSNFVGTTGGGSGGVLAIYLKKGEDLFNSLPSAGETIRYRGFSVIREFYSPNYAVPAQNSAAPDQRITLHWKPDLFVSGVNPKLPIQFYNNDRTRSFKIVVEGMTVDGKFVLIEKLLTPR